MGFISDLIINVSAFRIKVGEKLITLANRIGVLTNLTTTNKTNLVAAINEVNSNNRTYYTYYNNGLTSSGLLFKDENGDDFSATSNSGIIYDIRLSTRATGAHTGARYVLYNDGSAWHVEEITPHTTSRFQARLRINSSGLPEIFNDQTNTAYGAHANVTVYRVDSRKGVEWKRFISLDYNLLFNTPATPNLQQVLNSGNEAIGTHMYLKSSGNQGSAYVSEYTRPSSGGWARNGFTFRVYAPDGTTEEKRVSIGATGGYAFIGPAYNSGTSIRWYDSDNEGVLRINTRRIPLSVNGTIADANGDIGITIPTVNNGQLTLSTGTGLSGSATFTANQAGSSTFSVAVASTHKLPTTAEWNALPTTDTVTRLRGTTSGTFTSGDLTLLAGANTTITQSGANITIASTNTNTTYTTETLANLNTGTSTIGLLQSAKNLNDWLTGKGYATTSQLNGYIPTTHAANVITITSIMYWNNAYSWGNHALAGYLTSVPLATSSVVGGRKLFSDTVQSVTANSVSTTAGKTYGVQVNSSGQMVVNVPWTDSNTVTQIGVNGANYTYGNLNFINGSDIQISKIGSDIRIDYVGAGGGSGSVTISLDQYNIDSTFHYNGFIHSGSYDFIESEAHDQTSLVFFAVRRANGYWVSPADYAREFYGKMGVRFHNVEDYTTQGTVVLHDVFSNDLHQFYEDRKFYLVAFHDYSNSDYFHGWADWDEVLNFRKYCHDSSAMLCILGKLIYDGNGKHSIDVDPKYF